MQSAHHRQRPKSGGRAGRTPSGLARTAAPEAARRRVLRRAASRLAYEQGVQRRHLQTAGNGAVACAQA
eukprot:10798529-Lingulodinium_polyedra.AAC.1